MMPEAKPSRAPSLGPPTMPATTARSSITSGAALSMRILSSTDRCSTRNRSNTRGTLARGKFTGSLLGLPEEDLDVVESWDVDDRIDGDLLLQGGRRSGGGAHPAHGNARREHAALQPARDEHLARGDLGPEVDEVHRER